MQSGIIKHSMVFFALATGSVLLPVTSEDAFPIACLLMVMTIGVSHGALDFLKGHAVLKTFDRSQIKVFYCVYIGVACVVVGLWYFAPVALLTLFLLIASYHFGKEDADFLPDAPNGYRRALYMAKGSAVIAAPLVFHPAQTEAIFQSLNMSVVGTLSIEVCASLLVLSFLANLMLGGRCGRSLAILVLDFASILTLNLFMHPLLAFSIYFCFLHSVRHSMDLMSEMKGRVAQRLTSFVRKALPLTLVTAVVFLAALYVLLSNFTLDESTNKVIFLGLAALTFPHVALEYLFESRVVRGANQ